MRQTGLVWRIFLRFCAELLDAPSEHGDTGAIQAGNRPDTGGSRWQMIAGFRETPCKALTARAFRTQLL
jgi:hypothetical protein